MLFIQAKLLKACGTIPETPGEIRKASTVLNNLSPNKVLDSSKFDPCLPNTSIQKLNFEMELDHTCTPDKLCENWVSCSGSAAHEHNR